MGESRCVGQDVRTDGVTGWCARRVCVCFVRVLIAVPLSPSFRFICCFFRVFERIYIFQQETTLHIDRRMNEPVCSETGPQVWNNNVVALGVPVVQRCTLPQR